MLIISVQVSFGWPRPRPPMGRVSGHEIFRADLVLVDDTAHPADHSSVIALQAMEILGPRFRLHGAWRSWRMNCKLFLWRWREMSGRWTSWSSSNMPNAKWCLMMASSSQPPPEDKQSRVTEGWHHLKLHHCAIGQPSICLSSTQLNLMLRLGFRRPEIPLHFLFTQLGQLPQKIEFVPTPLRHTAQGPLLDF